MKYPPPLVIIIFFFFKFLGITDDYAKPPRTLFSTRKRAKWLKGDRNIYPTCIYFRPYISLNIVNLIETDFLTLFCLRETDNALQLPVFFLLSVFFSSFYQPCPGFRNCKSLFLILRISICRIEEVNSAFSRVSM